MICFGYHFNDFKLFLYEIVKKIQMFLMILMISIFENFEFDDREKIQKIEFSKKYKFDQNRTKLHQKN